MAVAGGLEGPRQGERLLPLLEDKYALREDRARPSASRTVGYADDLHAQD